MALGFKEVTLDTPLPDINYSNLDQFLGQIRRQYFSFLRKQRFLDTKADSWRERERGKERSGKDPRPRDLD